MKLQEVQHSLIVGVDFEQGVRQPVSNRYGGLMRSLEDFSSQRGRAKPPLVLGRSTDDQAATPSK